MAGALATKALTFRIQVQAWQNTLLRGQAAKASAKPWRAVTRLGVVVFRRPPAA